MEVVQNIKIEPTEMQNMDQNVIDISKSKEMTDYRMSNSVLKMGNNSTGAVMLNGDMGSVTNHFHANICPNDFIKIEPNTGPGSPNDKAGPQSLDHITGNQSSNDKSGFHVSIDRYSPVTLDDKNGEDNKNETTNNVEMYIFDSGGSRENEKLGETCREDKGEPCREEKGVSPQRKKKKEKADTDQSFSDDKKLKCNQCSAVLSSRSGLNRHMLIHTRDPHSCDLCDQVFQNKNLLKMHKKKDHPKKKEEYACTVCDKKFAKMGSLEKHQQKHDETSEDQTIYECKECSQKYKYQKQYEKHIEAGHEKQKSIFSCDVCGAEFSSSNKVRLHMNLHTGEKLNQCQYCNAVFLRSHHLENHIRQHTGEQPFECEICGKRFRRKSYLKDHARTHTGEKPFQCEICKATLSSKWSLRCHQQTHPEYFESVLENAKKDKNLLIYTCDVCNKIFKRNDALKNHIMKEHTGERPFKCLVCNKGFRKGSHLINHSRQHTGECPFVCEVCGGRFRRESYLKIHMRKHTGERPFECTICTKRFSDNNHLRKHLMICTLEKKIHECDFCKKKYKNNGAYTKHLKICQESFGLTPNLDFCLCEKSKTSSISEKSDGLEDQASSDLQESCLSNYELDRDDSRYVENKLQQSKNFNDGDSEMEDSNDITDKTEEKGDCEENGLMDIDKHSDDLIKCKTCGKQKLLLD